MAYFNMVRAEGGCPVCDRHGADSLQAGVWSAHQHDSIQLNRRTNLVEQSGNQGCLFTFSQFLPKPPKVSNFLPYSPIIERIE